MNTAAANAKINGTCVESVRTREVRDRRGRRSAERTRRAVRSSAQEHARHGARLRFDVELALRARAPRRLDEPSLALQPFDERLPRIRRDRVFFAITQRPFVD